LVSYHRDKAWLQAKAAELRHQADRMERRAWDQPEQARQARRG